MYCFEGVSYINCVGCLWGLVGSGYGVSSGVCVEWGEYGVTLLWLVEWELRGEGMLIEG